MKNDPIDRQAATEAKHKKIFQEIIVEYPSYNPYPEYKGKPYFSIKYTENRQEFIGFGTYKPEVLSEYLKEYFMPSAFVVKENKKWLRNGKMKRVLLIAGLFLGTSLIASMKWIRFGQRLA